jgi:hypothetical protein
LLGAAEGGAGDDQMWGDTYEVESGFTPAAVVAGDDHFVFVNAAAGEDIIWDFNGGGPLNGDLIELDGYAAGTADIQAFSNVTTIGVRPKGAREKRMMHECIASVLQRRSRTRL